MGDNIRLPDKVSKGLNNVADPKRLGIEWLTTADNIVITDKGAIERCEGFTLSLAATAIAGAYATKDLQRLFVVDDGDLLRVNADMSAVTLKSGLSSAPVSFEEINGQVYYTNGVDFGVIDGDAVHDWGIASPPPPNYTLGTGSLRAGLYQVVCTLVNAQGLESGNSQVLELRAPDNSQIQLTVPQVSGYTTNVYVTAVDGTVFFMLAQGAGASVTYDCGPDELGVEIEYWLTDPPRGTLPAEYGGCMYIAEWFPELDLTVIWRSLPLRFHHFDVGAEGISVPGRVLMLKSCGELIIGTDRAVMSFDGTKLGDLADYGVVPGWHAAEYDKKLFFWTKRGLCRALPFINLTESTVSVPPGASAGATVIERDGMRRYVVALQKGGTAFNQRT